MKITDLYFGIVIIDFNTKQLTTRNLFNDTRIMRSIATYITKKHQLEQDMKNLDPVSFCFGDTRGHCEYETLFHASEWPYRDDIPIMTTNVYEMYVLPNSEHLMRLVDSVSKDSAKKWLEENVS